MVRYCNIMFVILLTAGAIIAGCGGGGGGGGGGSVTLTGTLTGTVLDVGGVRVGGATVTVSGSSIATVSGTTNSSGYFSISGVPLGVGITITISKTGLVTKIFDGISLNPTGTTSVDLDVVMSSESPPAGSTLSLQLANGDPMPAQIYVDEERWFKVIVMNGYGDVIYPMDSGWKASVFVTGNAGSNISTDDPSLFKITANAKGSATITILLTRVDGTLATKTVTMPIEDMESPPPPPL